MKPISAALLLAGFLMSAASAFANSGDFSGAVAVGSSYAGTAAPTDGLIVEGNTGIGTTSPGILLTVHNSSANFSGITTTLRLDNGGDGGGDGAAIEFTNLNNTNSSARIASTLQNTDEGDLRFQIGSGTLGSYTTAMIVAAISGDVGIGTTSPAATLDVNGTVHVGSFGGSTSTAVCQNSGVLSTCSSAERFKENIHPSDLGLNDVLQMQPVTFDFKDHKDNWEKHDFGFVAEDMEKINPLFVTYDDNDQINGVRYMQLTAVNVKAIQQLHEIIETQQGEIETLKQEIARLSQHSEPGK